MADRIVVEGPFAVVPAWVIEAEISAQAFRLYAVLARRADNGTGQTFPSRRTLSEALRCSVDTVDRALQDLHRIGAVTKVARQDARGDQKSNLYTVRWNRTHAAGGRTDAATPQPHGCGTELDPSLELDPTTADAVPQRERRPRARTPRDDLWDAIARFYGTPQTPAERSRFGRVVNELTTAGATAEQVDAACAEMRRRGWEDPSPLALSANWTSLTRGRPRRSERSDETDPGRL